MEDRPLFAVEDIAAARASGPGAHVSQVVAGATLGVREGQTVLALHEGREDPLALGRGSATGNEPAAEPHRGHVGLDNQGLSQRLHDNHHVHAASAVAAMLLGKRHAEDAHVGQGGPHGFAPAGGRGDDRRPLLEGVVVVQVTSEGIGKKLLLLAQVEVHRIL